MSNLVNSETKLYCVIGDPIKHSKSPIMHNRAFSELSINAVYTAFHILPNQLEHFMQSVKVLGIGGVNVTIPHKLDVMNYLDEIDEDAKILGAVNTIVNENGKLIGHNTDGIGYVRSLKEEAIAKLSGTTIVVIGAGGAARGIVYTLLKEKPKQIIIANRSLDKAHQFVQTLAQMADCELIAVSLDQLPIYCQAADVVINTTSVGMYPNIDETPVQADWLKPGAVASDLIYNPLETAFIKQAKARGCIGHSGLGMFIYQGAYAFEYWTKQAAPVATMRQAVLEALQQ